MVAIEDFFDPPTPSQLLEGALDLEYRPERRLIANVIIRAAEDARNRMGGVHEYERLNIRMDAADWIMDDSERPWGFRWCCRAVGQTPEAARRELYRDCPDFMRYWEARRAA